jgi:cyclophilin family peptidyl-prolyl cis-trans isomerase
MYNAAPSQRLRHRLAALFLLGFSAFSTSLQAVAPAAPSNGKAEYTHFGYPKNDKSIPPTADWRSWYVTWQDNANDEEGYFISVRYGTVGPFYPVGTLNPDSTSVTFSVEKVSAGFPVQIRIEAWKNNGAAVESSSFIIATTIPAQTGTEFAPPSALTGTGATATAVVVAGAVTSVTVNNPGSGYTVPPSVIFGGGNGTGAVGTATVTNGQVTAITVTTAGTGYTESPTVTLVAKLEPTLVDKDPSPSVTDLEDGRILLSWKDNSSTEQNFLVRAREFKAGVTDSDWIDIYLLPFNQTSVIIPTLFVANQQPLFIPGKAYDFQVRATRNNNIEQTNSADCVPITIPSLKAPSGLNASTVDETQVRVTWADNSTKETGYEVEFRSITSGSNPPFELAGTVGENTNSVTVPVSQNSTIEFRVRAVFAYTPTGASTVTKVYSDFNTGSAQATTQTFAPPSELTAVPRPGAASTILLTWKDNSLVESGFDILARPAGGSASFKFARAVQNDVTSVSVDSIAGTVGTDGRPTATDFVKLTPGTEYEFVVRAVGNSEGVFSLSSNTATATPRVGFSMPRLYHPAQVGQLFNYQLNTSSTSTVERTAWTVTGLPSGLTFNSNSGLISGTPLVAGVFLCPLTATFSNGVTASSTLTLRIVGIPGMPLAGDSIPNITVGLNSPAFINLADKFTDPDAETAVRMETSRGNIDLMLFPSLAPKAVANFLAYVNAGDYNNVIFHRALDNFVLQAGSVRAVASPNAFTSVGRRNSPENEPGISNLRGTISSAKVGGRNSSFVDSNITIDRDDTYGYIGLPNSATTDFFLNIVNNAANLDNQNGGFTTFGRMTTASLAVMDQIAALPKGNYSSSSPERRLNIDGSFVPFATVPMNADTAPVDMDVNKTVRILRASVIPSITYSTDDVSADKATVVVENGQLKVTGLTAGSRTVNVTARDLDGNTISQSFTITVTPGFQPAVISKQPISLTVNVGTTATLAVVATGTDPTYQWRRGGTPITGKTSPTLALTNVQAGEAGVYDVVVSAGGRSVTSSPATLTVRVPTDITSTLPTELLVEAGRPLDLSVDVTGSPEPTFTWKRGSTTINGQTSRRLLIPSASLSDAGIYSATATNGSTKDQTNKCTVLIVEKRTRTIAAAPGKPIKLAAPAAGPFVSYSWRKGGASITQPGVTGIETATLSIAAAQFGTDSADFTCVLTPPGTLPVTISGIIHLAVSNVPQLNSLAPITGIVGVGYQYALPYNASDANTPTSFSITGLPPGLTLNTATGVISGRPTKAGTFPLTAKATNPSGTSPVVNGTLLVLPTDVAAAGAYVSFINPRQSINQNKGGRMDLTITDNTAWSAKVQLGKDTYNLKGNIVVAASNLNSTGSATYLSQLNIPRKTGLPLSLYFEINPSSGELTGIIASSTEQAEIFGYRLVWNNPRNFCIYAGAPYNLAIGQPTHPTSTQDIPQGNGYMTLNVSGTGTGIVAGILADGTKITGSTFLGSSGQYIFFQMLYKNTGSFLMRLGAVFGRSDNTSQPSNIFAGLSGTSSWVKDPQPSTERNYQTGFPALSSAIRGTQYLAPKAENTPIVMNLPNVAGNVTIDFEGGGLGTASRNPDLTFRLLNSNKADFTGVNNPAKVTLNVIPTSGAYSGTYELEDSGLKRTVKFQGLVIPAIPAIPGLDAATLNANSSYAAQSGVSPTPSYGVGYYLLDKLPVAPSTKSAALLSGSVRMSAPGISITTQPVSQIANPGANVTFTCAATGGLGATPAITYQWRKNGINILTATTATLELTSVQESAQASYDCVIRKGTLQAGTPPAIPDKTFDDVSIVTTEAATLTINDPVTDVIVTQTPARSVLPTGSSVTFTAEQKGTGPFTYQWRRNGVDIGSLLAVPTFTIPSIGDDEAGIYTVLVRSSITTSGVASTGKSISHAAPVTAVTLTRSPAGFLASVGSSVTFTATSDGLTPSYQWLRNDIPIPAASGPTFTIPSTAVSDQAIYKVAVTNSVTPDAIVSNQLPLHITTALSNITITPSFTGQAAATATTVTLTANVTGNSPNFQWRKNGTNISGANTNVVSIDTGAEANLDSPDIYDVLISNTAVPDGILSSPFPLRVAVPVSGVIATRSPSEAAVANNTTVVFSVSAIGSALSYQWFKGETDIPNANQSTYTLTGATQSDNGTYSVRVSNILTPAGITVSTTPLTVIDPVSSASITLVSPGNPTVAPSAALTFTVSASGGGDYSYQWQKNMVNISDATGSIFNTTAESTDGETTYRVLVFNPATPFGFASEPITITVINP